MNTTPKLIYFDLTKQRIAVIHGRQVKAMYTYEKESANELYKVTYEELVHTK